MKIVVSGGWGYGNLGDDAILNATLGVLRRRYQGCRLVVLTYDLEDSRAHAAPDVELRPCVHALVDQGACEVLRPVINKNYSRVQRKLMDLRYRWAETAGWFRRARRRADLQVVASALDGADLYVMGGGGYFNEKWLCKTRSQLLELDMAHERQVPVAILGPGLGRFSGAMQHEVSSRLARARIFTVRDAYSKADAERIHPDVRIIPDIALSAWLQATHEAPQTSVLGVVFNNQGAALRQSLAQGIAQFLAAGRPWRVELLISRQWKYDFEAARALQLDLLARGVSSEIVMASDFMRLEQRMAQCRLVVSENLHGLILAARNLVPVLAINDYPEGSPNFKKFKAFLSQSDSERFCIAANTDGHAIASLLTSADADSLVRRDLLKQLRSRVKEQYSQVL